MDETQLEHLSDIEDDYYLLFCNEKDNVQAFAVFLKKLPNHAEQLQLVPCLLCGTNPWVHSAPNTPEEYAKIFEAKLNKRQSSVSLSI